MEETTNSSPCVKSLSLEISASSSFVITSMLDMVGLTLLTLSSIYEKKDLLTVSLAFWEGASKTKALFFKHTGFKFSIHIEYATAFMDGFLTSSIKASCHISCKSIIFEIIPQEKSFFNIKKRVKRQENNYKK